MTIASKTENFEKVRKAVMNLEKDFFTNYDLEKITSLNHAQIKRILLGLQELNEVKFIESSKIYVRVKEDATTSY